jgi:2,3-bisphosphoglycerate-independent phosphoglycerate mutase
MAALPPHLLIVLDGWGHSEETAGNAIALANTPTWDQIWQDRPHCLISGSGIDVGLPEGQMGNSEVGHMNLGAGRVVNQVFTRIGKAIAEGSFFTNEVIVSQCQSLADSGKALHIFGLLSPGGVHSHESHIIAAIKLARDTGVNIVWLHAFLDGRDVPPKSAMESLQRIEACFEQASFYQDSHKQTSRKQTSAKQKGGIASIIGRYYAMDRDNRWERVALAYNLITHGHSDFPANTAKKGLEAAYRRGETDEFVLPTSILADGQAVTINDGDGILFMNFRADRAREITRTFTDNNFPHFDRGHLPDLDSFVSLTEYADDIDTLCAFKPDEVKNSLGEYLSSLGLNQLRIAETEKYAHVTFFFSGGREQPFPNEDRLLIPSPQVATYDLQPTMSAPELTDELINAIRSEKYPLIICNYANGDMVGHTGNLAAAIEAVECLDECLSKIFIALDSVNGHCLITADHGNVEKMSDHATGQAHTAHTTELVPLVYHGGKVIELQQTGGTLSDIAPTLLALMELDQPIEMTGQSLLCQKD